MDVESEQGAAEGAVAPELQWGHVLLDVERTWHPLRWLAHDALQWGHVLLDVESSLFLVHTLKCWQASMGPRPVGRGEKRSKHARASDAAASMGPRPVGRGERWSRSRLGRGGRRFNGATSCWTWRGPALPQHQPGNHRFNGATSCWTWREAHLLAWGEVLHAASMGPRPVGRGETITATTGTLPTPLQWGHVLLDVERKSSPWIATRFARLQWGHVLLDVESARAEVCSCFHLKASMGPRPVGRGETEGTESTLSRVVASMGPRPVGRGESEVVCFLRCRSLASMGPRPVGRGEPG